MSVRTGRMSVDLGLLKAGLYEAAHRAGVSPSVLARKAIAALLDSTASESGGQGSRGACEVARGGCEESIRMRAGRGAKSFRISGCAGGRGNAGSSEARRHVGESRRTVVTYAGRGSGRHAGGAGWIDIPDRGARAQCESDRPLPE